MTTLSKSIISFFIVFVIISKGYAQNNADPGIGILMSPSAVVIGSNGILKASAGNYGNQTIVKNSLRVSISVGSNAEILGIATESDKRWSQLNLTDGSANTIKLTNTGGGFDSFDFGDIILIVRGNAVSEPNLISGSIVYVTAQNSMLCEGCVSPPLNISQGNASNSNDISKTSLAVICNPETEPPSLTVPADVILEYKDYNSNINFGVAVTDECCDIIITQTDVFSAGSCGNSFVITRTWTASDVCGNITKADQIITVQDTTVPVFIGIQTDLCIYDNYDFDLSSLLDDNSQTDAISWSVTSGNATINGSLFNPFGLELGDYIFTYSDSNSECPSITEFTVSLNNDCAVCDNADNVIISKAVTPNGDQHNEYFTVEGIEGCGFTVEVEIFNRWGAKIYESKDYQNNWNGFTHNSSFGGSDKVTAGTYFYVVSIVDSVFNPFVGHFYLGI